MRTRAVSIVTVIVLGVGCAGRSSTEIQEPSPQGSALELPSLVFPTIDSATLDSLNALLGRLQHDTSLFSAVSPSDPRVYSLMRELEAAQSRLAESFITPDATGQSLYDRLTALTQQVDSVFKSLETRRRQPSRP